MPQIFSIGPYLIYIWTNEGKPLEPIHVHVAEKHPEKHATKIWITKHGKCYLSNNTSNIPEHILNNIIRVLEARSSEIREKWKRFFGKIDYYC